MKRQVPPSPINGQHCHQSKDIPHKHPTQSTTTNGTEEQRRLLVMIGSLEIGTLGWPTILSLSLCLSETIFGGRKGYAQSCTK